MYRGRQGSNSREEGALPPALDARMNGFISALLYPIQFERDPVDGLDRVLEMVVRARALDGSPEQYAAAIDAALRSDEQLSRLIPQPHPEPVIRTYLAALRARVERGP
jgi:alkanesulfonate monooxygenase SsuD/methylene tetrahydromethanopterin reductase-like flavin-dependent oxidoreductase (luciferase family)